MPCCVFVSKYYFLTFDFFLFHPLVVLECVVEFLHTGEFSIIPSIIDFQYHTTVAGKDTLYNFYLLAFVDSCFVGWNMIGERVLCAFEKKGYYAFRRKVLYMSVGSIVYSVVQICFFLIESLYDPLIIESRVLTISTIIVLAFIFPINSVSICFTYLGFPMLGALILTINIFLIY